jgi:tetratricopeptide (TPR) repeat protein
VSYNKIGRRAGRAGQLDEALKAYRDSLAIRERLAAADRGNTQWQRDLAVSYGKIGDVLRAQGKLDEALAAFRADLAISERLAAADPGNTSGSAIWRCRTTRSATCWLAPAGATRRSRNIAKAWTSARSSSPPIGPTRCGRPIS